MTTILTQEQLTQPETERVREKLLTLHLTGSPAPLVLGHALDGFQKSNLTPIIGTEFARGVQLAQWLLPQPMFSVDPVPARLPLSALAAYAGFACLAAWVAGTRTFRSRGPTVIRSMRTAA